MTTLAEYIKQYECAEWREQGDIAEKAMALCASEADWGACIEAFGERVVGDYVAQWADETAYPYDGAGYCYIQIEGTDRVIASEWFDDGRVNARTDSLENAESAIAEINAEINAAEAEESDDESESDC
jgi:hypothetical protein